MDGWSFTRTHISELWAQDIAQLSSLDYFPQKIWHGAWETELGNLGDERNLRDQNTQLPNFIDEKIGTHRDVGHIYAQFCDHLSKYSHPAAWIPSPGAEAHPRKVKFHPQRSSFTRRSHASKRPPLECALPGWSGLCPIRRVSPG